MPKMMLHRAEARAALGRGVAKLTLAVQGTLGPKGMNAIIDRPIGTPIVSRDGVSIADEVELPCRFENMGAQVVREVSKQTNEVAGDGTTTATVLANALIQDGLKVLDSDTSPVDLVAGIDRAAGVIAEALRRSARPLSGHAQLEAVATIAATDPALGRLVAEALGRVGSDGIVEVQFGPGITTTLEVVEGMSFDRGYISHHMVTDVETMRAVLDDPLILITDQRISAPAPDRAPADRSLRHRPPAADHRRRTGARGRRQPARHAAQRHRPCGGGQPAGVRPLAEGHAGGYRDPDRRPRHRPRSRRQAGTDAPWRTWAAPIRSASARASPP